MMNHWYMYNTTDIFLFHPTFYCVSHLMMHESIWIICVIIYNIVHGDDVRDAAYITQQQYISLLLFFFYFHFTCILWIRQHKQYNLIFYMCRGTVRTEIYRLYIVHYSLWNVWILILQILLHFFFCTHKLLQYPVVCR